MKKAYVRPVMAEETFKANEYVATCYSGSCDITGKDFKKWDDLDNDNEVDDGEIGSDVVSYNEACPVSKQWFNAFGEATRVVGTGVNGEQVKGYYVEEKAWIPFIGLMTINTHVSSGITETGAS